MKQSYSWIAVIAMLLTTKIYARISDQSAEAGLFTLRFTVTKKMVIIR